VLAEVSICAAGAGEAQLAALRGDRDAVGLAVAHGGLDAVVRRVEPLHGAAGHGVPASLEGTRASQARDAGMVQQISELCCHDRVTLPDFEKK
jgi:hypothetical protein